MMDAYVEAFAKVLSNLDAVLEQPLRAAAVRLT